MSSGQVVTKTIHIPVVIDQGVYSQHRKEAYQKGDGVSYDGSFWIAQRETSSRPGTGQDDWRLAVKKGRDAVSGYQAAKSKGFKGTEVEWLEQRAAVLKDTIPVVSIKNEPKA